MGALELNAEQTEIFNKFQPLVRQIARNMTSGRKRTIEFDDAVQEGLLALAGAVKAYDPDRGVTIKVHCASRVRAAIIDAYRRRFGRGDSDSRCRFEAAVISAGCFLEPDNSDRGGSLGLQPEDHRNRNPCDAISDSELSDRLRELLTSFQRKILDWYYCCGLTSVEIAKKLGVSSCYVRNEISAAVNAVRTMMSEHVDGEVLSPRSITRGNREARRRFSEEGLLAAA